MTTSTQTPRQELNEMLSRFSAAEEFLDHLGVDYQPGVVHVYRLHILKRFHQYLNTAGDLDALDTDSVRERYRALLTRAYNDFVHSTAQKEKVFKVFQDQDGQSVKIEKLRMTLPSRQ